MADPIHGCCMRVRGVVVLESRQGRRIDGAEQSQLVSPRKWAQQVEQVKTKGLSPFLATREKGQKKGHSKTDLEGRSLHTVAEADGA